MKLKKILIPLITFSITAPAFAGAVPVMADTAGSSQAMSSEKENSTQEASVKTDTPAKTEATAKTNTAAKTDATAANDNKASQTTQKNNSSKTTSTTSAQPSLKTDSNSESEKDTEVKTKVIKIEGVKTTVPAEGNYWAKVNGYFHFVKDGVLVKGWKHFTKNDGEKVEHYSYFDKNGRLYTGWHQMGKAEGEQVKHYSYFGPDGWLRTGWQSMGNGTANPDGNSKQHYSYFGNNGWLRTGWQHMGSGTANPDGKNKEHYSYFGNNGWLRTGWQKMATKSNPDGKNKEHYSYFGENGWLVTGWQWMDKSKGESKAHWSYFDGGGWLTTKTVKLNGMTCNFSNAGWLTKFETLTPHHNQYKYGYFTGCAGTSLLMGLQYKGHLRDWSLPKFMDTMPYTNDGNPNNGFVGNPKNFNLSDKNRGIYPKAIAKWGARYGNVIDFSGNDLNKVTDEVRKGNPVIILATWNLYPYRILNYSWGSYRPENHHFFLLVGYDYNTDMYKVMDPLVDKGDGSKWLDGTKLRTVYNQIKGAVAIRG